MNHHPIAIIGIGSYYPGAKNLRELWENILSRRRQFREMPKQRLPLGEYYDAHPDTPDKTYARYAAVIDGFAFDWAQHRIPKTTYESTDIVHWLALEVATQALIDAGYSRENIPKDKTGVIVGNTLTGEFTRANTMRLRWPFVRKTLRAAGQSHGLSAATLHQLEKRMETIYKSAFSPVTEDTLAGGLSNTIAGRICNFYDLHGGGYVVDGACSSSLIAVATAAGKLANGELDLALAGGVDISLDPLEVVGFAKTGALTNKDMNVYDRHSSGFIPGEGCGFVMLKRLEDARKDGDYVYAVIRGWGISSDGKGGITAPKVEGQSLALLRAYEMAGYSPHELDFIEGHGTGTVLGDRIELEAIALALDSYGKAPLRSCGVTSFKSLVGHTKAAAGIGGLIKAALSVNQRVLAPTAACHEPNDVFRTTAQNIYPLLQGEVRARDARLRAGVSAMGFGGINCHVTLESADLPKEELKPEIEERALLVSNQETELFVFAADAKEDLLTQVKRVQRLAAGISVAELTDLAYWLAQRVKPKAQIRAAVIADHPDRLAEGLALLIDKLEHAFPAKGEVFVHMEKQVWIGNQVNRHRVGFLFPGQGSQKVNMARTLLERFPWARKIAKQAWEVIPQAQEMMFRPLDRALHREEVQAWEKMLSQTEVAQPAIVLASVLWKTFLERLGIQPQFTAGHSLGELTALCAAGAYDKQVLFQLAATRGKAMSASEGEAGAMASLHTNKEVAEAILAEISGYAVVANLNSPSQTVISGEKEAVAKAVKRAQARQIQAVMLPVSNAFHSKLVKQASSLLLRQALLPANPVPLSVPFISGVTGEEMKTLTDGNAYFAKQVMERVDFISLIAAVKEKCDLLVEVGPGRVLTGLVTDQAGPPCFPVESKPGRDRDLHQFLATYFVHGGHVQWERLYEQRLIRPFVPAEEKQFIVNPCENPLSVPASGHVSDDSVRLPQPADLPTDIWERYLEERGAFLLDVIRADLKHMRSEPVSRQPEERNEPPSPSLPEAPPVEKPAAATASVAQAAIRWVAQRTGYPSASIALSHRLLDDLNLDSIKSAELVSSLAQQFAVADRIDPSDFANATLEEVCQALERLVLPEAAREQTITQSLLEWTTKLTGYPRESIHMDMRLLDDLNLDSIKSAELVSRVANEFQLEGQLDPTEFANTTLREIEQALSPLLTSKPDAPTTPVASQPNSKERPWVRNFVVDYVEAPCNNSTPLSFPETARFLIVVSQTRHSLARALAAELTARHIPAEIATFTELAAQQRLRHEAFSHVVVILPQTDTSEDLSVMIKRLQSVIGPVKDVGYETSITYIQYGGGYFGTRSERIQLGTCTANAFAASLHMERPHANIRVIDLSPELKPKSIVKPILAEIAAEEPFVSVGYDQHKVRRVPQAIVQLPQAYPVRPFKWTSEDVVLVTGGAKGITAECALAVAQSTGVKMALVGRSTAESPEIQQTLARFRESGLICRYYSCDMTDQAAVEQLIASVREELGPVTGVIHGAALMQPRRAEQISPAAFLNEIGPKVLGALHLCKALETHPPKLFIGISSLAGITGMAGNTSYGFSNEALQLILRRFGQEHPSTQVLSVAFSVWDEVGMGVRAGSIDFLEKKGTYAIPVAEGTKRFVHLFHHDPQAKQVVITAKLGGLETWRPRPVKREKGFRFIGDILYDYPEVEFITRVHLNLEKDPYVKDHVYNGTYLFPAVFGLEAMAQAASYVTGIADFNRVQVDDIQLTLPIVLDPQTGVTVEIRAEVLENGKIKTELRTEQNGFAKPHYTATFWFPSATEERQERLSFPKEALAIEPKTDLYGPLLFQGPSFHRLAHIYDTAHNAKRHTGHCLFTAHAEETDQYLLGDPYFHDALLQSARIITPQDLCLPVKIASFKKLGGLLTKPETWRAVTRLQEQTDSSYTYTVDVLDKSNQVVLSLTGYQVHKMEHHPGLPTADELSSLAFTDERRLTEAIRTHGSKLMVDVPVIALTHCPGIHQQSKEERHARIMPLFKRGIAKAGGNADHSLTWDEYGKPVVMEQTHPSSRFHVSFSHDDEVSICVIGNEEQGCDILPIDSHRSEGDWLHLLTDKYQPLMKSLQKHGDSESLAGSRIWASLEAAVKAGGGKVQGMEIEKTSGEAILLHAITETSSISVLTIPVQLSKPLKRMVALVVSSRPSKLKAERQYGEFHPEYGFVYRFPLTFKDTPTLSRKVNLSRYADWMGKIRELSLSAILKRVTDQFASGKWGMVTNFAQTEIVGEASSRDVIEVHLQIDHIQDDTYMEIVYHWYKVKENGTLELIATSKQGLTWVEIIGHGLVRPCPFPDYFSQFLKDKLAVMSYREPLFQQSQFLREQLLGPETFAVKSGPSDRLILQTKRFETSLEESNLVGNVYFSNYTVWQSRVRDQFFYSLAPELFQGTGKQGEWLPLFSKVHHLREAMPFDTIEVQMSLAKRYEYGVNLFFEYYKLDTDGQKQKIAYGEQEIVWIKRDERGHPVPAPLPEIFEKELGQVYAMNHSHA
ncbi:SDR family NAD(P)-dependent oxidoreductase [Laceyella putida]|uniref:SDR family NAD(P)-dependent oxidoreductase n=1 Tax=Laceyella putida TaxID=110101 RepID=A0ABW2RLA2_9BACL